MDTGKRPPKTRQNPRLLRRRRRRVQTDGVLDRRHDIHPDGKMLITGSRDNTIRFFEMPTMNEIRVVRGRSGWVRALAVSPDGKVLISAGDDSTIRFWDIATGRNFRTDKTHTGPVRGIALSPDGLRLASASWDRTVKL
ncbi:MAG: hypothetical protein R3B08_07880 [Nitrospira sp.]